MILILHIIKAYPKSMLKRYIISNYIKIINNLHFKFRKYYKISIMNGLYFIINHIINFIYNIKLIVTLSYNII